MTSTSAYFPDFEFPASELSAYSFSVDFFIISLKSQQIVDHRPDDIEAFRDWLDNANIRDIYADSELDQLMKAF